MGRLSLLRLGTDFVNDELEFFNGMFGSREIMNTQSPNLLPTQ
jgi:hypothetical protein